MYERFDKSEAVSKGEFSFLIALGKQLDRALELGEDAPDWLQDALGRLAHALDGLTGDALDAEEYDRGSDGGSEDDDDSSSELESSLEDGGARQRHRGRALGGAVAGLKPAMAKANLKKIGLPFEGNAEVTKEVKRGKKSKKARR